MKKETEPRNVAAGLWRSITWTMPLPWAHNRRSRSVFASHSPLLGQVSTDQYAEQGWSRVEARAKPCQAAPLAFLPPFFARASPDTGTAR